jgi:hypothetical protein
MIFGKSRRQFHERWPQPAMDIRNFSVDELADQDIWTVADGPRDAEYFTALWMRPPASSNRLTGYFCREARNRTARGLQDDSMTFDECECLMSCHDPHSRLTALRPKQLIIDWFRHECAFYRGKCCPIARKLGGQDFDGDFSLQLLIARAIHLPHTAFS